MATTLSQILPPPPVYSVLARIATPVGPSAERDGGTAGNVDRVRAEEQGSTARHSRRGLGVGVDRGNMQTKHVCMRVCVQLRLARVRSQNCVGKKNMRWQTSGISLADDDSRWSRC